MAEDFFGFSPPSVGDSGENIGIIYTFPSNICISIWRKSMTYKLPYKPIEGVRFQPWVGENYRSGVRKLLVLGMSHYRWEKEQKTPDYFITNSVIGHWSTSKETRKFFTNIAGTCIGHIPNTLEREKFWDAVAFYNYIQEFVGDAPRQSHDYKLWQRSEPAFAKVLLRLKPKMVLVIGRRNWRYIASLNRSSGERLRHAPEPKFANTWRYPVGSGETALAFHVKHTSAGYNFRKFWPLFQDAEKSVISGRQ
jgi:hypothetical protein